MVSSCKKDVDCLIIIGHHRQSNKRFVNFHNKTPSEIYRKAAFYKATEKYQDTGSRENYNFALSTESDSV